ncbi:MAG: amidohydrolase family protein [Gemmatimonadetes bacterium]|nr:amidohydrolase family protein [Gemmatimonadota bacterium]
MKRRTFVRASAFAGAGSLVAPGLVYGKRRADLVLRGATVFDGTGREDDIGITGDRITDLGPKLAAGSNEIDLTGLALAPGFIDVHSHADMSLLVNNNAESRIRQGVTLEVVGQDGGSVGPWSDEGFESTRDRYRRQYNVEIDFRDPVGFLGRMDREGAAVNLATMVGNGALRGLVVGNEDRPATDAEIARMQALLRQQIEGGCVGLSSGLEYTPSGFADADELVALASVLQGTGYPYASHMRNEDDRLLGAVEEALHVGRVAGVPVQISHLKAQGQRNYWKADAALNLIERARAEGVDVHFDRYPYTAYSTGLSNLFPNAYRSGGNEAFLRRLRAPDTAARLERACRDKVALLGDWNSVQITSTNAATAYARGKLMGDLARDRGVEPYALTLELLEANGGGVGMIGHGMGEENTAKILAHPLGMVCSDGGIYAPYGPLSGGSPHPRGYGTFPRLLGHYVRDTGALTLESAIHKVTQMPAQKLKLGGRGVIEVGAFADLVAFDPSTVSDQATFEAPHQYPVGIPVVVVNGVVTLRDGEHTGQRGGRAARGSGVN